ncbi:MAG: ATP-dependent Clp protease ATP-binding subunit [Patescibacteria group bacterium]
MKLYFNDPRFNLSGAGEFFVRTIAYSSYAIISALIPLFIFSEVSQIRAVTYLIVLFLADRLLHLGEADKKINDLTGEKENLAEVLTPASYSVLNHSFRKTLALRQNFHLILLQNLLDRRDVRDVLLRLSVKPKEFEQKLEEYLENEEPIIVSKTDLLKTVEAVVGDAYNNAHATKEKFIEPRNIFVALCSVPDKLISKLFALFDISSADLREVVVFGRYRRAFRGARGLPSVLGGFANQSKFLRHRVMNRAWTARPTPTLDQFGTDLTSLARQERAGFLVGHKKEMEELLEIISRPGKPNVFLIGDAGSGKSTIIEHLAWRMIKDDVPKPLFDKRLISLEVTSLISNATPEILAERLKKITEEVVNAGNVVLFIPNIHDLFRTSAEESINAIDILLPIIKHEEIPVIGETDHRQFKQFIEPRSDFLEQFESVEVAEISEDEAIRFLIYSSLMLEREFKVFITFRALKKAVVLAHKYFRNKLLPGSAVDLLKQSIARAADYHIKILEDDIVIEIAEEASKIPIQRAGPEEVLKLLNLEETIHRKLVNQETAVKAVAGALREYRSGLSRKGGPIATFLFVGPTGVGKTELAKILTEVQFGSKDLMQRFDMSEYQSKDSIFRFIGTPDGSRTGTLTDAILKSPYSLILLDEFEKAHPDILNLFLQVFDDGRLTDSLGRTVGFENTIIIATSNAHSEFIKSKIEEGETIELIAEDLKKKLTEYFKPELLNRFSNVVVFRNLTRDETLSVTKLLLGDVIKSLQQSHGIELIIEDDAVGKISELGYSPVFGARPLRQVISENVKSILAEKILKREIDRGNKVEIVLDNNEFQFNITE